MCSKNHFILSKIYSHQNLTKSNFCFRETANVAKPTVIAEKTVRIKPKEKKSLTRYVEEKNMLRVGKTWPHMGFQVFSCTKVLKSVQKQHAYRSAIPHTKVNPLF
jgi:hypothetical protein